jgi:membrane associated rhomboid family serine protease
MVSDPYGANGQSSYPRPLSADAGQYPYGPEVRPARLPAPTPARRPLWRQSAVAVAIFVALLYLIELVDVLTGDRLQDAGIEPREVSGLRGVLFAPALHADWQHLMANTVPLLVLGFLVFLSGVGRGVAVTAIVWIAGGVGTWLTGGANTIHLGASMIVFGWLAYLIVRGVFTREIRQIGIGIVVLLFYGGLLWGVLPGEVGISWQGHLFGAVGGVIAAWVLSAGHRRARSEKALGASTMGR